MGKRVLRRGRRCGMRRRHRERGRIREVGEGKERGRRRGMGMIKTEKQAWILIVQIRGKSVLRREGVQNEAKARKIMDTDSGRGERKREHYRW